MRAIVTGGAGFIGYNLCKALDNDPWNSWEVVVIDDLSSGRKENKISGFQYIYESINKPGIFENTLKKFHPDVIFHLAAIPRVSYSVSNPMETFKANTLGTMEILESIRKTGKKCRLINSSSSSIYGDTAPRPTHPSTFGNPKSPYALEKWQAEEWCRIYSKYYDLDVVSLRYFNVFGPGSLFNGGYSTVLSAWGYHLFVDPSTSPYLEGDGSQSRDFCYVDNVVQANLLSARRTEKFSGESLNVAHGESHSLIEVKNILEQISGKKLALENKPERIGDVKHTLADITETKKIIGYSPKIDFEIQVNTMMDWYKHSYHSLKI